MSNVGWKDRVDSRKVRLAADPSIVEHGKLGTYTNWRCRCPPCIEANTIKTQRYRDRKKNLGY